MNLNIDPTIGSTRRKLNGIERSQIPFATALALTRTAQTVKKLQQREMGRVFESPTRFTVNSLRITPAKKTKLSSRVDFKNELPKGIPPSEYLQAQVSGGQRNTKRSERWLRRRGVIDNDEALVPSKQLRLNKHGNVTRGRMTKMLSNLDAHFDTRQNTRDETKRIYFVATINGTKAIWKRHGKGKRKIKPEMIITRLPQYTRRYDFHGLSERHARRLFPRKFKQALIHALSTAKK